MNPRPNDDDSIADERAPALTLTRELHGHLVAALAAKFGDELEVDEAQDPDNGVVSYRFEVHGAACSAGIVPYSDVSAVLSFSARLGRVSRGYTKALRWLGHNRAFNTLAIAYREDAAQARDLWVGANRNTLSGDIAGIRFELDDFCVEIVKAITGLKLWFPQFFEGIALAQFERDAGEDERFRLALAAPRVALKAIEASDEAMENFPLLYCYITRWLGEWERNLRMLDSEQLREWGADNPELEAKLPGARLRALLALRRHREVMEEVLPKLAESEISSSRRVALQAECLCELDQAEDALETLQSAELDDDPWVHFIRSYACMKLGRQEEAAQHLSNYEGLIGPDMLARRKLAALSQDDDDTENTAAD